MKHNICLSLYDDKCSEIYSKWYGTMQSVYNAKSRLQHLFKDGYTWVVWQFSANGKRLLLSSSRPLPYVMIPPVEIL